VAVEALKGRAYVLAVDCCPNNYVSYLYIKPPTKSLGPTVILQPNHPNFKTIAATTIIKPINSKLRGD